MAFGKFREGCKAEAVLSKTEEGVTVSFDGWNAHMRSEM